jgi:hypothetical protein
MDAHEMRVGVLGSGPVGGALADGFLAHGYEVMRGSRDPAKLGDWLEGWKDKADGKASTGTFDETAAFGDIVVLAVKGAAAETAIALAGPSHPEGKVVIDTTNPISDAPPTSGVLHFFTSLEESLMERLQRAVPGARFVKAFSIVGNPFMVDPDFGGLKPSMFICGNDDAAKATVRGILEEFSWEVEDMGAAEAARAIEPVCILWCIPGFLRNEWSHAFKLLKK